MLTVLIISFIILLLIGMPVIFAIGVASVLSLLAGDINLIVVAQKMVTGTDSFSLLAIPFFILAGEIMHKGGLATRLIHFIKVLIGHYRSGLTSSTVVSSMFFAALSGSAPATTASIGSIMIPEMEKQGYKRSFSTALASAAGPIGQIIPPSIPMIVYAVLANISVGKLFLAGILPGILIGLALMITAAIVAKKNNYGERQERASFREIIMAFGQAFWALLAPVIILGGIYGGIFTPTEAAVVAVIYGFVVSRFVYKSLSLKNIPQLMASTVKTSTIVVSIISVAYLFGWILAKEQAAIHVSQYVLSITDNPIILLLLINVMLLLIGAVMDNIAAMIILLPVLLPIGAHLGIDPIHFGAIIIINFAIGMATPPIGYSLFVGCSISDLSIEQVSKAIVPFIIAMIICLLLITYIPTISLFIPNLFG
jgi:tripartite ATP-independent transporter DctM subunit